MATFKSSSEPPFWISQTSAPVRERNQIWRLPRMTPTRTSQRSPWSPAGPTAGPICKGQSAKDNLQKDMKVWLLGGGGAVRIVIMIKWSAVAQDKVKGPIRGCVPGPRQRRQSAHHGHKRGPFWNTCVYQQ